jgi:hypothetical protein
MRNINRGLTLSLICLTILASNAQAAVINVTTLAQKVSSTGGCSLQEAIYSSNLHDTLDGVHGIAIDYTIPDHFITTGCALGTGNDTIILPTGYPTPTFLMTEDIVWDAYNYLGPTATPLIFSNITIEGYGATLQSAGGPFRMFAVGTATITTPNGVASGTGSLTLQDLQIKGFQVQGGNGADGGGGGLGAGGAIYVQGGTLLVERCTFNGNQATGGNGGGYEIDAGGGGGLGGNGGSGYLYELGDWIEGGGGGGARGNGGSPNINSAGGGGGGGTVEPGAGANYTTAGGPGGYLCGGNGGDSSPKGNNGAPAKCPGGGGGGAGASTLPLLQPIANQSGANGAYGGGGGGGNDYGGSGGFGGGGGAGSSESGGSGGFGAGGAGNNSVFPFGPGSGGVYGGGGSGSTGGGGGGGALGGAIFGDTATITIEDSTFASNVVTRGLGAQAANGTDAGGAVFVRDGSLTINDSTISLNQGTGNGGGVAVYNDSSTHFVLENTIIASNGANECYMLGGVNASGVDNLIVHNASGDLAPCPAVISEMDPELGTLQVNAPGLTPTMAIPKSSPAFNMADAATSLSTDQRSVSRPQYGGYDIGAYELCYAPNPVVVPDCVLLGINPGHIPTEPLTMQVSPAGGGTTNPAVGTIGEYAGGATVIQAFPSPGYYFVDWTGPAVDPNSASTTVLMNGPETVTANFALCNCASNVSGLVSVTQESFIYNPATGRFTQNVVVTNNSMGGSITGPISLVLDSLSSDATLYNASGKTDSLEPPAGSSYINMNANLEALQSITFTLQFTDPTKAAIKYYTRVLAGPGQR